jgi:hypothetical protein
LYVLLRQELHVKGAKMCKYMQDVMCNAYGQCLGCLEYQTYVALSEIENQQGKINEKEGIEKERS